MHFTEGGGGRLKVLMALDVHQKRCINQRSLLLLVLGFAFIEIYTFVLPLFLFLIPSLILLINGTEFLLSVCFVVVHTVIALHISGIQGREILMFANQITNIL